jgi:hypothetical protein
MKGLDRALQNIKLGGRAMKSVQFLTINVIIGS